MHIEERGCEIFLKTCQYAEKFGLVEIIYKYKSSIFNLHFQIVIYHPILSNNCNNVFPSM